MSKKRKRIEVSLCAWIDLLGYGAMLRTAGFDLTVDLAQAAIKRLDEFHLTASRHADRRFNIFAINDGLICSMDLSPSSGKTTMDFFTRVIELHNEVNKVDVSNGYYGARTVLATGFRLRKVTSLAVQSGVKEFLLRKVESNSIDVVEAIHMASKSRPYFGIIPELQANFAFTKAYLIDHGGKAEGFEGPHCFIDLSIFTQPLPKFVTFGKYISWGKDGLSAKIGQLDKVDLGAIKVLKGAGFLDANSIAEQLTNAPDAAKRIQKITKVSMKEKHTSKSPLN